MGAIYWLASYPKSGNTWSRLVLANYRANPPEPVDINHLGGVIASSQQLFDNFAGLDASELTPAEIERYRPLLYLGLAAWQSGDIFIKIHDAFARNADGIGLVPAESTAGVIYLLRNPLDVAASYANHSGKSVQEMVNLLCRPQARVGKSVNKGQVAQQLFSWSGHVRSWVDDSGLPVYVARYEDMLSAPEETFGGMLRFAGYAVEEVRLQKALDFARFDRLQAQEAEAGFNEKPTKAKRFFRKGQAGAWREELTPAQVQQIISANRETMIRFGYLTPAGEPLY